MPDVRRLIVPNGLTGMRLDAGLARFTWLAGLAELTAPGCWAYGARGFTSGLANVAPASRPVIVVAAVSA